jgi:hypothetical protein
MTIQLKPDLEAALRSDHSLKSGWERLRDYKETGGTREEALAILECMRDEASDEQTEDRILELMDFVAAFCAPHSRLWDPLSGPAKSS